MSYPKYKLKQFESQYPVTQFFPNTAYGKKIAKKKIELKIRSHKVEIMSDHWTKSRWKIGNSSELASRIENVKKRFMENEKTKEKVQLDHIDTFLETLTKHEKKKLEKRQEILVDYYIYSIQDFDTLRNMHNWTNKSLFKLIYSFEFNENRELVPTTNKEKFSSAEIDFIKWYFKKPENKFKGIDDLRNDMMTESSDKKIIGRRSVRRILKKTGWKYKKIRWNRSYIKNHDNEEVTLSKINKAISAFEDPNIVFGYFDAFYIQNSKVLTMAWAPIRENLHPVPVTADQYGIYIMMYEKGIQGFLGFKGGPSKNLVEYFFSECYANLHLKEKKKLVVLGDMDRRHDYDKLNKMFGPKIQATENLTGYSRGNAVEVIIKHIKKYYYKIHPKHNEVVDWEKIYISMNKVNLRHINKSIKCALNAFLFEFNKI